MGDTSPKKSDGKSSGSGGGKYTPPAARRSTTGDGDGAVVLAAPSRATNVPVQYPMLTDTNYSLWAIKMKVLMKALRVWSAIDGSGEYDQAADEGAFAALSQSVPDHVMLQVADCDTAQEAWEAVRMMRMGVSRVREATAQIAFKEGETLDAFGLWITALVNNVRSLGDIIDKVKVVQKILREVPS